MSEIDELLLNVIKTLALFIPYAILSFIFYKFKKDNFFLKARAETQYSFVMAVVAIAFLQVIFWQLSDRLAEITFLGFDIAQEDISHKIENVNNTNILYIVASSTSNTVLVLLATLAATIGWLFSARAQTLNSRRAHSMQLLIESRMSETYTQQVNELSLINFEFSKSCNKTPVQPLILNHKKDKKVPNYFKKILLKDLCVEQESSMTDSSKIPNSYFEQLNIEQKNIIFYMLNYLEFISVGIRFGDLDENLMKQTLKGILKKNYETFEDIIINKQKTRKECYEHLTELYKRWENK